jgi:hypothetical protein
MLVAALLACALRPVSAQSTTTFVTSLSGLGSVPIGLTPLTWPGVSVVRSPLCCDHALPLRALTRAADDAALLEHDGPDGGVQRRLVSGLLYRDSHQ